MRQGIFDFGKKLENCSNRAAREQLQARINEMNQESADSELAIHDLGLKLHRAYRRRDKRDGGEGPTHLWVSRVTAPP